jgi:hypothetical protein
VSAKNPNQMDQALTAWLESQQHLPSPLRDFHDQKDLLPAMHDLADVQGHQLAGAVDRIAGQSYVIDVFLWFMARRGYTLQRSRARLPFRDLRTDVAESRARRLAIPLPGSLPKAALIRCAADRDGDCDHSHCPQLRDNEPAASGRHCPLDTTDDE